MKFKFLLQLFLFLLVLSQSQMLSGQTAQDLKAIKVDELSDAQIESMIQQAARKGYGPQDVLQVAQMQGISAIEVSKLSQRISSIQSEKQENALIDDVQKKETVNSEEVLPFLDFSSDVDPFGLSLFNDKTRTLSFETNLRIPTPKDYIIGPGDQIQINIHGSSERAYNPVVNNEGNIILQNVGPIHVSGLTTQVAESIVRNKLAGFYQDLGSGGSTYLYFSIAKVRNIKVNLVGELKMPGTYTVNGLSSVMNALYVTGGPTVNGTFRNIRIYRKNELVGTFDIYKYLLQGQTQTNVRLQNDDVIMVGPYTNRVLISGEVKKPGIYELKNKETVKDAIQFAGGFSPLAYSKAVYIERNTSTDKMVVDVLERQFELVSLRPGDQIHVRPVINRFQNRVFVKGAVYVPGRYELKSDMTVGQLIKNAEGLRGDAHVGNVLITRSDADLSTSTISLDLSDSAHYTKKLQREDILHIPSIYDLTEEVYVKISGEVRAPGTYKFSKGLTAEDLIIQAGGYLPGAIKNEAEIARKARADQQIKSIKQMFSENRQLADTTAYLQPFDHVMVRRNPAYIEKRSVEVIGEVMLPGIYYSNDQQQRISDIINQAGGLKETAFLKGASLIRQTEYFPEQNERQDRYENFRELAKKYDTLQLSTADQTYLDELWEELWIQDKVSSPDMVFAQAKRDRLQDLSAKNPLIASLKIKREESIPLELETIVNSPGSSEDLILQNGDVVVIPKKQSTVRLRGSILYPNTVSFIPGRSFKYYINEAGGFDVRSHRKNSYVVYANGSVDRTRSFLFLKNYPKVEPGSEIIVPVKPVKVPVNPGQFVGITSGLTAMVAVIIQLVNTTNP